MTTAQVLFSVALGVICLIVVAFAIFVYTTTVWSNRWVRAKKSSTTIAKNSENT